MYDSNVAKRVCVAIVAIMALSWFAVVAGEGNDDNVAVCHNGNVITISENGLNGHGRHSNHEKPCEPTPTVVPTQTLPTATSAPPTAVPPTPTPLLTPTPVLTPTPSLDIETANT